MARLIGIIANRPDLCGRFVAVEGPGLRARQHAGVPWSWGIGFQQNGELLMKRRPLDDRHAIGLPEMLGDVQSDLVLAHVRRPTVGALRTENTHPFRYQQWLFADTGTITGFDRIRGRMLESLPDFLRRAIRGETDSEVMFHLFLSFLHDAAKLDDPTATARDAARALRASHDLVQRLARDASLPPSPLNVIVAQPEFLLAARFGPPMAFRLLKGREGLTPLYGVEGVSSARASDLDPCRLSVVASDFEGDEVPTAWTPLADGAMMAFTRTDEPTVLSLVA